MNAWNTIADHYWVFALIFLGIKNMGFLMKWDMVGFSEACRSARNDIPYTIETPIIGLLIDPNNSWIYLSLGFHIAISILNLYTVRIMKAQRVKK